MTAQELMDALMDLPEEERCKEVYISYNSGDYWRTVVAEPVEQVSTVKLIFSEYHRKQVIASDDADESKVTTAVILEG